MRAWGRWGGRSRGVQREKRPSRHEPKRRVAVAARGRTVDRVVSRAPAPALRLVEEGRGLIGVERGARVPVDRNLGLDPSLPVVRRIRWGCCCFCCCGGGGGADAGVAADWGMWVMGDQEIRREVMRDVSGAAPLTGVAESVLVAGWQPAERTHLSRAPRPTRTARRRGAFCCTRPPAQRNEQGELS